MVSTIPHSPPQIVDGITLKFPAKLWRIVNTCKSSAISWDVDGNSIIIDRLKFDEEYLKSSVFFKTTNFPSFIRQLNIYGFRKMPSGPKAREGVFEYRHDCFRKEHPDLLSEVVRHTAIRRTKRENSFRDVEANHGKLDDFYEENPLLSEQHLKKVDELHPLLKTPAVPVMKYGVPTEPLQKSKSRMTTLYINPCLAMCDMQRMSPSKLHHQVTDILTGLSDEQQKPLSKRKRTVHKPAREAGKPKHLDQSAALILQSSVPTSEYKCVQKPILFLPSNTKLENTVNIDLEQLSQESCTSQKTKLMFSCPIGRDDDLDDFEKEFHQTLTELNKDNFISSFSGREISYDDNMANSHLGNGEFDVFNTQVLSVSESLMQFGEEQGFLTPAYFDPDTGIVTLVLPSLNAEY